MRLAACAAALAAALWLPGCTGPAAGSMAASAAANTVLALGASAASRASGGCYASCPTGTRCDPTSGLCVSLPCGGRCQAHEQCVERATGSRCLALGLPGETLTVEPPRPTTDASTR